MNKMALNSITPTTSTKLKEKMITSREAIMLHIIRANKGRGSPKMTARFLMFL